MKATSEFDPARAHVSCTRNVLYSFLNLVPRRVEFICWRISRRFDGYMVEDQRIQVDNLAVVVEEVDGELAGNVRGYRGDLSIYDLLAHHLGRSMDLTAMRDCSSLACTWVDEEQRSAAESESVEEVKGRTLMICR